MSYMRCLTTLSLLLVAGCTASALPEAEPKAETAVAEGFSLIADGGVVAPIPSVGLWIDKGDPPPSGIGRPHLGRRDVARPAPEAAIAPR